MTNSSKMRLNRHAVLRRRIWRRDAVREAQQKKAGESHRLRSEQMHFCSWGYLKSLYKKGERIPIVKSGTCFMYFEIFLGRKCPDQHYTGGRWVICNFWHSLRWRYRLRPTKKCFHCYTFPRVIYSQELVFSQTGIDVNCGLYFMFLSLGLL